MVILILVEHFAGHHAKIVWHYHDFWPTAVGQNLPIQALWERFWRLSTKKTVKVLALYATNIDATILVSGYLHDMNRLIGYSESRRISTTTALVPGRPRARPSTA